MKKYKIISLVGSLFFIFCIFLWLLTGKWLNSGLEPKAKGDNDYAIILGAKVNGTIPSLSLQYRLESALKYAYDYPNVTFILSGGQGPDEDISEAEAMKNYLLNHDITEDRLILENKSTSTYENFIFSKALLPGSVNTITVISSDYHLARAKKIASEIGFKTDVIAAKTPRIVQFKVRTRERIALLKTYLIGK